MAQRREESWLGSAARLLMRLPGESRSALAATRQHGCEFSEAAVAAATVSAREVAAAAERWSKMCCTVASHANEAAIRSGIQVARTASSLSAAVTQAGSLSSDAGHGELSTSTSERPGVAQGLTMVSSRFACMIGGLGQGKMSTAVPGFEVLKNLTAPRPGPVRARLPNCRVDMMHPSSSRAAQRQGGRRNGLPHSQSAGEASLRVVDGMGGVVQRPQGEETDSDAAVDSDQEQESGGSPIAIMQTENSGDGAEPDLTLLETALEEQQELRPRESLETAGCALPEFLPYSSKLSWHRGPRAFFSMFFPKYGNYCGPNWSSGRSSGPLSWDKPPIDHLDYCCYRHDMGYDSHDQRDLLRSDLQLLRCLETLPDRVQHRDKDSAAISVAEAYRVLCIVGLRRFLIPYRRELVRRAAFAERAVVKSQRGAPR